MSVSVEVCIDCNSDEAENNNTYEYDTNTCKSLLPNLVAETKCLECAPESVCKVESKCNEPDDVKDYHPD